MRVQVRLRDIKNFVHKDLRTTMEAAHEEGWTFERSGTNHFTATSPQGLEVRFGRAANTQGDVEAIQRSMWKAGLSIPNTKFERRDMETPDTTMAVALTEAGIDAVAVAKPPAEAPFESLQGLIIRAFEINPKHAMGFQDLLVVMRSKGVREQSVSPTLSVLKAKGILTNPERGYWKLVPEAERTPAKTPSKPPIASAPPIPAPPRLERKKDSDVDVLNRLLHAMADAEGVIRRLIEKQEAINSLKEVLNK